MELYRPMFASLSAAAKNLVDRPSPRIVQSRWLQSRSRPDPQSSKGQVMKTLIISLVCVLCIVISIAIFAQSRNSVVCKDQSVPDGYMISGETLSTACAGTAWVIKPKPGTRPAGLDRFTVAASNDEREPVEAIAPGQCDQFEQTVRVTYNFNPALMNDAQVK